LFSQAFLQDSVETADKCLPEQFIIESVDFIFRRRPTMPNTTNLDGGSSSTGVGLDRNVTSSLGKQIQSAVSRANLEARVKDNETIKGLYDDVQKMVSRWSLEDKLNIISTYGNANNLPKGANEAAINNETTLTLISNLDKEELKKIIASEESRGRQLIKDVYNTNTKTAASAKKRTLTRKNFESITSNPSAKMASGDKALNKYMKKNVKGTTIPKGIVKKFPGLRKELEKILSGYTNYELGQTSLKIGNDFPEGIAPKELISQIINKCVLYVSLIIGTNKNGVMIGSIDADESSAIEDLLEMTSFAWVAGKAGLSNAAIVAKRKRAMNAKKTMESQKKISDASWLKFNKIIDKGKLKVNKKGELKTGFHPIKGRKVSDYIEKLKKAGVLDSLSDDQIKALALKKGLPAEDFEPATLKEQLYQVIATEQLELDKKNKTVDKLTEKYKAKAGSDLSKAGSKSARKAHEKLKNAKASAEAEMAASTLGTAGSMITANPFPTGGDTSDKIPVVNFNEAGNIISSVIAQAVPVIVVGNYDSRGIIQDKKTVDNQTSDLDKKSTFNNVQNLFDTKKKIGESTADFNERIKNTFSADEAARHTANMAIGVTPKSLGTVSSAEPGTPTTSVSATVSKSLLSDDLKKSELKRQQEYASARARGGKIKSSDSDLAKLDRYREENEANGGIPIAKIKKYVSSQAYHILKKSKINNADVNPVFDINKSHEYAGYLETIRDYLSSIAGFTSTFYTAFAGLQEAGLTVNGAAATGALAKAQQIVQGAASMVADSVKFATGGKATAASSVSHVVTGDSPVNKNNTELVSVDWASKQMKVTPVPKMATGGNVSSDNSGVSSVSRMTSGDRNKPLSVGIATGVVKYTKAITDAEDDGSGTAVKVYSVNTGIDEKIKIGDSEASLFDMVYGIYNTMATVAQGISTSNQLLTSISANTASTNGYAKTIASKTGNGSDGSYSFPTNLDSILSGK
jgi:hypothetical protein